ncbi:MAG: GtrA family protein [Alphaproteobacteria bacterium]
MTRTDIRLQFAAYLVVGGLAFVTELAAFLALLGSGLAPIPASVASFLVATVANYILSRRIAFARGARSVPAEAVRFLAVAAVGLLLNTAIVWALLALAVAPTIAKIAAVAPVLAWNFLGRRALVFSRAVPDGTWRLAGRLATRPAARAEAD